MLFSVILYFVQNPSFSFFQGWANSRSWNLSIFHFSSIFWVDHSCRRHSSTLEPGLWSVRVLVIVYSSALEDWFFEICPLRVSPVPSFLLWWSDHHQYLVGKQTLEMVKDYRDILPLVQLVFLIGQCKQQTKLEKVCHHKVWPFLEVLSPVAPLRNYHVLILHNHHWNFVPMLLLRIRTRVSTSFSVRAS